MSEHDKGRPAGNGTASKSITTDVSSLPDAADMLNGLHVVLVAYKVAGEIRYRRRFYLNLSAAQRAVDRAVERGHAASVTLCRLAPVRPSPWQTGGAE